MNKRIFLISILIFSISFFIYGQNDENYYKIRDEAYNLYKMIITNALLVL